MRDGLCLSTEKKTLLKQSQSPSVCADVDARHSFRAAARLLTCIK